VQLGDPRSLRLRCSAGLVLGCSDPPAYDLSEVKQQEDEPNSKEQSCALQVSLPKLSSECVAIDGKVYTFASTSLGESSINEPWVSNQSL